MLRPSGSLFLHADWRASHRLRVGSTTLSARAASATRSSGTTGSAAGRPANAFARKHDTILFYARSRAARVPTRPRRRDAGDGRGSTHTRTSTAGASMTLHGRRYYLRAESATTRLARSRHRSRRRASGSAIRRRSPRRCSSGSSARRAIRADTCSIPAADRVPRWWQRHAWDDARSEATVPPRRSTSQPCDLPPSQHLHRNRISSVLAILTTGCCPNGRRSV